jgi:hypothetical protein
MHCPQDGTEGGARYSQEGANESEAKPAMMLMERGDGGGV